MAPGSCGSSFLGVWTNHRRRVALVGPRRGRARSTVAIAEVCSLGARAHCVGLAASQTDGRRSAREWGAHPVGVISVVDALAAMRRLAAAIRVTHARSCACVHGGAYTYVMCADASGWLVVGARAVRQRAAGSSGTSGAVVNPAVRGSVCGGDLLPARASDRLCLGSMHHGFMLSMGPCGACGGMRHEPMLKPLKSSPRARV